MLRAADGERCHRPRDDARTVAAARERLRAELAQLREVYLDIPAKLGAARSGERDDGYEEPYAPDLRVPTYDRDAAASIAQVVSYLEGQGLAPHDPPHPSEAPPTT